LGRGGAAGADEAEEEDEEGEEEEEKEEEAEAEAAEEAAEEDEDEAVVAGFRLALGSTSFFRRIALIGSELQWMSDDKERMVCAERSKRQRVERSRGQRTGSRAIAWTPLTAGG
jgi:hypothetical protein